jgi:hypothetical protein
MREAIEDIQVNSRAAAMGGLPRSFNMLLMLLALALDDDDRREQASSLRQ